SDYRDLGPLANPANDADLMAESLRGLDFEVMVSTDLDQKSMKRAIKAFGRRLDEAGSDSVGLFYYAGHGVQVDGANFLIPIGAEIERESDVDIEAVDLNWVLTQMEFAANRLNFLIIDACRNNPIIRSFRTGTRGLAQVDAPRGTLIAYATEPGGVAADGSNTNSPYTRALVKNMQEPGRVAEEVFRQVRVEVLEATDQKQVPWESSSLTGAFYFNGEDREVGDTVAAVDTDAAPAPATPAPTPPAPAPTAAKKQPDAAPSVLDANSDLLATVPNFDATAKDTPVKEAVAKEVDDRAEATENEANTVIALNRDQLSRNNQPLATVSPPEVQPLNLTLFAQKRANLRKRPSIDAKRLTTLDAGHPVKVTGDVTDRNWYRVAFADDQSGFIWKPLLGEQEPIPPEDTFAAVDAATTATDLAVTDRGPSDLTGRWLGEYRCQGDVIGFSVDIKDELNGQLKGVFEFFPIWSSPSVPRGSYAVSGQVRTDDGLVQLWGTDWIDRPDGFQQHALEGQIDEDGEALRGQIMTVGCTEFVLSRN
ncbi:MAG: caspase family protein, partial [Geminicoccaceae bacterium]